MIAMIPALLIGMSTVFQPPAAPPENPNSVLVIGNRIRDYRRDLEACLARRCAPDEDIAATMALAETLFLAGEYRVARTALRDSIGRNGDEAARYPEPVSDLYRANSRVARHLGMDRDASLSTRQSLRALRAGLPVEDYRHFTVRLEIVESLIAFGQYDAARRELSELAGRARRAGRDDVAETAQLRELWIDHLQTPHGSVRRRLTEMSQWTDRERQGLAIGAKMLLVRIYSEARETERADALLAELGRVGGHRQLVYNPPYQLAVQEIQGSLDRPGERFTANPDTRTDPFRGTHLRAHSYNTVNRIPDNFENKWIDVGFWVQPDGSVSDLQVVQRGGRASGWEAPLMESIRERRYEPGQAAARTYRLERYTYTSAMDGRVTGTHLSTRSPRARLEYFDLTGATPGANNLLLSSPESRIPPS